jgi:HSP20 family molecular chaperone IbpA
MSNSKERRINLDNNFLLGFDNIFNDVFSSKTNNYPPHNIYRLSKDDPYSDMVIEIALAGIRKEDINITVTSQDMLKVEYNNTEDEPVLDYVHKGIAKRRFVLEWRMNKDLEVEEAKFDNGMLYIKIANLAGQNSNTQKIDIT